MVETNKDTLLSNSEHPDECIRSMMRREGDVLERNFLRYREVVRDVFRDMNLSAIKYTQRRLIEVDKKTNSITVPCNFLKLSSISIIDAAEKIQTLIIDTNIKDDIVDVSLKKDCGCECGCNSSLCGHIKNYEAILEDVTETLPDDSTKVFTKITRKVAYPDGSLMVKYTYPIRIYGEDGEWTSTEDTSDEEFICKLDVKKCGCIENTERNRGLLAECMNADTVETDCGCTATCVAGPLTYNVTEEGDRFTFPSNFQYDKVLLRCFVELSVKDIRVPLLAKSTFLAGLKHMAFEWDETIPKGTRTQNETKYNNRKDKLASDLHKCSLAEFYNAVIPHRRMV